MDYHEIDRKLCEIGKQIRVIFAVNPLNLEEEKKKVFQDNGYNPQFEYGELEFNPGELKEELNSLGFDDSVLGRIFNAKRNDLIKEIEICENIGKDGFTTASIKMHSKPEKGTVELARKDLAGVGFDEENMEFDAVEVQKKFREHLKKYGLDNDVRLVDSTASNVMVERGVVFLRKDLKISRQRLVSVIRHEIDCHVLRAENGSIQKFMIFREGFPGYLETEEGLAIYLVNQLGLKIKRVFFPQIRAILVGMALEKSFSEIFKEALKYGFLKEDAWELCSRIKRGLKDTSRPGAFTKDAIYYSGYLKVRNFLKSNPIEDLYYGKISIESLPDVRQIEGLKEPKLLPERG